MGRKLIIDGNAVYEIDEDCIIKNQHQEENPIKEKETEKRIDSDKNKRRE